MDIRRARGHEACGAGGVVWLAHARARASGMRGRREGAGWTRWHQSRPPRGATLESRHNVVVQNTNRRPSIERQPTSSRARAIYRDACIYIYIYSILSLICICGDILARKRTIRDCRNFSPAECAKKCSWFVDIDIDPHPLPVTQLSHLNLKMEGPDSPRWLEGDPNGDLNGKRNGVLILIIHMSHA